MFTYAHVKWFYGQSEHAYYLNYFINVSQILPVPYFIAYFRPEVCKTECNSKDHKSSDNNEPDSPQPSLIFFTLPLLSYGYPVKSLMVQLANANSLTYKIQ